LWGSLYALGDKEKGLMLPRPAHGALVVRLLQTLLVLFVPAAVHSSPIDMLGVGGRAMSMGSAYTAVSDDVLAIYYNPAGLAQLEEHELLLGYLWSNPALHAESPQVPDLEVRQVVPYHLKCPVVGLAFNLDTIFENALPLHARVGVLNLTPDNFKSVYRDWDPEPSTARWFRYGDYWDRVNLEGALSLQADGVPWVSLGIGFRFIISGTAFMVDRYGTHGLTLDLSGHGEGNSDLGVDTELTPTAGVMLYPMEGLRLGYCFRDALSLVLAPMITQAVAEIIPGKLALPLQLSTMMEAYYMPQQHTVGISYQWTQRLLTSFDLSFFRWSRFAPVSRGRPDPPWKDILIPRVGLEWRVLERLALRAGYFFEPSPVPDQIKSSNYLDNDRHVFSAGIGYTFEDPLRVVRKPMSVDMVVQYMRLPSRKTLKDPGYSPLPGYETRGEVVSVGGNISFHF